MAIDLHSTGGRYPFGHYDRGNIRASLKVTEGRVLVRIDDVAEISRWEELTGDARELLAELLKHSAEKPSTRENRLDP